MNSTSAVNSWDELIGQAAPEEHYVQFYKADEPLLNRNVGKYLWEGLLRGDGLLVISAQQRRESLTSHLQRMGADVAGALRERQLVMLDAQDLLRQFMTGEYPDRRIFEAVIREALGTVRMRAPDAGVRAYGEMVGVLWQAHQYEAAIQLEEYWNKLLHATGISLFCGYPIDVFGTDLENRYVKSIICAHTHTLPAGSHSELVTALDRALDDVLGATAVELRNEMKSGPNPVTELMPPAEAAILWIRNNRPREAEGILTRARRYYEEIQAAAATGFGLSGTTAEV